MNWLQKLIQKPVRDTLRGRPQSEQLYKLAAEKPSSGTLTVDLERLQNSVYRKEIDEWQAARKMRYNTDNPRTWRLQQIYADALLDAHLSANIENRILRIQNKEFALKDKNGNIDADKTQLLRTKWFGILIRAAMESIFYGYSVAWLKSDKKEITDIELIDRNHIIPERKLIVLNVNDEKGINIKDFPNELLYMQLGNDAVGLLEKIVPMSILKRHSWANWDEFEQLFGIPIRIARTFDQSDKHRREMKQWLEEMGTSAYAVLPKSVDVELKENNRSDAYEVFLKKIEAVNTEISKLVNGQTMTMDNGSSRSQSETHLQTQSEITKADMVAVEHLLNGKLLPILRSIGYPIAEGDYIDIYENTSIPANEKIEIDSKLMQAGYLLDKDYIEQTYDCKIAQTPQKQANTDLSFFD